MPSQKLDDAAADEALCSSTWGALARESRGLEKQVAGRFSNGVHILSSTLKHNHRCAIPPRFSLVAEIRRRPSWSGIAKNWVDALINPQIESDSSHTPNSNSNSTPTPTPTEETNMNFNTNKIHTALNKVQSDMIKRVDSVVIDLQGGQLGIETPDGVVCFVPGKTSKDDEFTVNPISFLDISVPAFAIRTELDKIEKGDVVIFRDRPHFVTKQTAQQLVISATDGAEFNLKSRTNKLLGNNGVLVVKNLIGGNTDMQSMLPLLLLTQQDGEDDDIGKMFAFMALAGQGSDMNAMLPMLMLGGALGKGESGNTKSMLPFLLMSQQNGEANSMLNNPLMLLALMK